MDKDEEEEEDSEISGCGGVPFWSEEPWLWARAPCRTCPHWCLITVASPPYCRYSVENAFFDEKEDACAALGEISVNTR